MSNKSYFMTIANKQLPKINIKDKQLIGKVCGVFAILMPLTVVPQIELLYSTKDAGSLSLAMWVLYTIGCIPFLLFGIANRHWPLIILNILWIIMQSIMIVGILMYS